MKDSILKRIEYPKQLHSLTLEELNQLAWEIRQKIIEVVSCNGGHLASSLGVVELTIALYSVFDLDRDKVIWDVGHQSYPHKLLTGRREAFSTLRKYGGISGFPRREESKYDVYGTGHASTSLSAALGLAKARDLMKREENIIAVIGDGALTGGIALEALNNIGYYRTKLIVILNDNEFSISRNIGGLARHLMKLRTLPVYRRMELELRGIMKSIPLIGDTLVRTAEQIEQGLQYLTIPGKVGIIFEEFGFSYIGPIDGHNISLMKETFKIASKMDTPVIIQVITRKGKGYEYAERDASGFHGVSPFNVSNGKVEKLSGNKVTYTQVFGDTLIKLAQEDDKIVAITAAMTDGTGLKRFAKEFPQRFFDVGIAEEHAVVFAAGLAVGGFKPVVAIYSTFLQRAYDPILHDVCLQNLPVVFAIDRSGIVGEDGATHQGTFDISYLRNIPGLTIMAPKDEDELRHMLKSALMYNRPVAIRYPRGSGAGVRLSRSLREIPLGKAEVLREGKDIVLLATGRMVQEALKASELLYKEGIEATVINVRFIKPLDEELIIRYSQSIKRVITIEENVIAGGFGSAISELFAKKGVKDIELINLGIDDQFVEHGSVESLLRLYKLDAQGIYDTAKGFLAKRETFPKIFLQVEVDKVCS